jgi:hypothetical protein
MQSYIPIFSVFIAALVLWVACQQHLLAKERFKLDLFEKRFAVYKTAEEMLGAIYANWRIETQEFWDYVRGIQDAVFLFGPEIPEYLQILHEKAAKLRATQRKMEASSRDEQWKELSKSEDVLLQEMEDELRKLKNVFLPYLKFRTWK